MGGCMFVEIRMGVPYGISRRWTCLFQHGKEKYLEGEGWYACITIGIPFFFVHISINKKPEIFVG